jgi:hypothetical protein
VGILNILQPYRPPRIALLFFFTFIVNKFLISGLPTTSDPLALKVRRIQVITLLYCLAHVPPKRRLTFQEPTDPSFGKIRVGTKVWNLEQWKQTSLASDASLGLLPVNCIVRLYPHDRRNLKSPSGRGACDGQECKHELGILNQMFLSLNYPENFYDSSERADSFVRNQGCPAGGTCVRLAYS